MRALIHVVLAWLACATLAHAAEKVVDIPTRPGVTQRFLLVEPPEAKAAVVLFAGGHGGLQMDKSGALRWGKGNFLVRSAPLFVANGLTVAIIDAPSDRQSTPYLSGYREGAEHAADVKAVIAWMKENTKLPVWLIGTSRGTQSAASVATRLPPGEGPNGIVLTASILSDRRSRAVPEMAVDKLTIPVLVVHHQEDACRATLFRDVPRLMDKLTSASRKELMTFRGGESHGDPCEAMAYHGFNGLEKDVVARIAAWVTAR
ncbi:MAG TPA: alpha/beta hydrolase [Burkholderiales bacterium]|nr:alpha/beta hydrolase [Burkholderiales bacterium]